MLSNSCNILNKAIHYEHWHFIRWENYSLECFFFFFWPNIFSSFTNRFSVVFPGCCYGNNMGEALSNCHTQLSYFHPKSLIIACICIWQLGRKADKENEPFSPQVHTTAACNFFKDTLCVAGQKNLEHWGLSSDCKPVTKGNILLRETRERPISCEPVNMWPICSHYATELLMSYMSILYVIKFKLGNRVNHSHSFFLSVGPP